MHLIDTHVHIDFYPDPYAIAEAYEKREIYTFFVTNLPEIFEKNYERFSSYKFIRLCLGYHPQVASEYDLNQKLFRKNVELTKYIGEVGLDFQGESSTSINKQIRNFEFITSPEFNHGRIYSIHSKKAEDEVLKILKSNSVKHAIFHWYTGKLSTLERIIGEGYYFSINYKMLHSTKGQEIIRRIPIDRILFETDGPFIRVNRKIYTPAIIETSYEEFNNFIPNFKNIVFNNFKRMLIEKDINQLITSPKRLT
jgi:TatD DNase family protein